MSSIYVVGASGYVGSRVVDEKEKYAMGYSIKTAGRRVGDIFVDLDSGEFSELLESVKPSDCVILLAAVSAPDLCKKEPKRARRINVEHTISLIEALVARGVRVVFSSSDVVYGRTAGKKSDDSDLSPMGEYGEMKAEVERRFANDELVKIIRFSYIYGGDKFTTMLENSAKNDEIVDVFSGFSRNIVSIDDVIEGIYKLAHDWTSIGEQVFNFSGPDLVSRDQMTFALTGVIPDLKFTVSEAPDLFWVSRSKIIETGCANFTKLLGREPRTLNYSVENWNKYE